MHRDPPHYLKATSTTRTPRRLMWLAARGTPRKRGGHVVKEFHCAALGQTWWTAKTHNRKDTLDTFDSASQLWQTVHARVPKSRRVVLFSYDLAEQIRLSQMLTHLPRLGWSLDRFVLEKTAAWCLLRNDKRTLMCCDLKSWCPVSWDKIVHDLNATNSSASLDTRSQPATLAVPILQAQNVREAVLQIFDWIEGEGLGQFKPTGSGQSYAAYRRRFLTHRLLVHDDPERLRAERTAMHTGRAEAWRHGTLSRGPYVEYDLHAAYATIGRDCQVPTVARGEKRNPSVAQLRRAMERYAVLADVTVDTDVECVPLQSGGRTLWPVGRFSTLLWDPELALALDYCNHVTVNHMWTYRCDYAIRDFCSWVLAGMGDQTQLYGLLPQRVLKHWSRCLVGRLGLRFRAWHHFGEQDPPDVRLVTFLDLDEGTKTDMMLAGTTRLLLGDMTEATDSLPQVPGWVMSKCRARLWNAMLWAGLGRIAYVDTDSFIIAADTDKSYGGRLGEIVGGEWAHKGTYHRMNIYGPRNLEVGAARRVSGLPLTAKQTAPLEFTGEVMRSVKESMRNGELDLVVSMPRTFHLQALDLRREHVEHNQTKPYTVREQVCDD